MSNEDSGGVIEHPDDIARQTLLDLVDSYGLSLADDPRRCEGLLRDHCGACRREINTLVAALHEHVTVDLLAADDQLPSEITVGRLVKRIVENRGLARDVAVWAVESWALACGVITPEELTPPPSPGQADVAEILLPNTAASLSEPMVVTPLSREEVLAQRQADGLVTKAKRLINSLPSIDDVSKRLECAENALSGFTEAMELHSDDHNIQKGLNEAFGHVADALTRCGNEALRKRDFSIASSYFRRTLEIDPGNAEAESRLQAIRKTRLDFLNKARLALDDGHYKSSAGVLEQVLRVFPDDGEIKAMLADAQSAGEMVERFKQQQLPELETQKKLVELLELIQNMQNKGLQIPEIDQYEVSLKSRIDSVIPILQRAEKSLAAGDYLQARRDAQEVLLKVTDHERALQIKRAVSDHRDATQDASKAIQTACLHRHWFKAKHLLLLYPQTDKNRNEWKQLSTEIEDGVTRSLHYWRLLPMVFLGIAIWILAGMFASMFSGGLMDTILEQNFSRSFRNSISESAAGQIAHLFLVLVSLPIWTAILVGRRAMRSLGFLFLIVIGHAVIIGGMMWLSKKGIQAETVRFAIIYGAASGAFLSQFMKKLLQRPTVKGYATANLVGLLVATFSPLISNLPSRYSPDLLTSTFVLAIVFCSLLQVLGLVRRWSQFAFVPIAVFLIYGIALGSNPAWTPYLPWINSLLIAGAVILLAAAESDILKICGVLMMAPLTTLLFRLAPEFATLPEASILIPVWLAVWGSLAIIHREDIEPNRQLPQLLRLWKTTRKAGTSVAVPEI